MPQGFVQLRTWEPDARFASDTWQNGYGSAAVTLPIEQAIDAARLGDPAAFALLVQHYRGTAERIAQQILRTEDAAADAVQEALIKAHRAMHRFEDGNFRSWLLRIVTNTCYDHLRRQKRRSAISLDELAEQANADSPFIFDHSTTPHEDDPEQVAVRNETMQLLLNAIDQLPYWHRNVILLVDVHGYDYGEAASLLKIPLGTVKSRLSRARAAMRERLVTSGVVTPEMFSPAMNSAIGQMQ